MWYRASHVQNYTRREIERRETNIESAVLIYRPQSCSAQKGTAH